MGMETEIRGSIDYSNSIFPDIIEKLLENFSVIGWGSSGSRYYLKSGESIWVEMYNGENEFFHRMWWYTIDKEEKVIHLEGSIKNYEYHYQRVLAIIARYLSKDTVAEGTFRYEEYEDWEIWEIKENNLFWDGKVYKLGDLGFLMVPLPNWKIGEET